MTNKKYSKILGKALDLCLLSDMDESIYGDCFIEIWDRGIEIKNPKVTFKNGKILLISTPYKREEEIYGSSIIVPLTFEQAIKEMRLNVKYQLGKEL